MEKGISNQPVSGILINKNVRSSFPLIFLLLWASGFSVIKIGLDYAEPLTFLALRYACIVVILLPIQIFFKLPLPHSVKHWTNLCIIGVLIQFVYFACTYLSIKAGLSAGALALIVSMQPILVGIISPIFIGETVPPKQWAGLLIGFAGAAVVIISKANIEIVSLPGIFFALLALIGMTSGMLYEKRTASSIHPVVSNLVQCSVGLALVLPLALLLEKNQILWTPAMVGSLFYLVVCNSLIAISILLAMTRHQQVARVSSLFFLVPPLAAVMASVLVDETMPALAWIGMILAGAGVWIANRTKDISSTGSSDEKT